MGQIPGRGSGAGQTTGSGSTAPGTEQLERGEDGVRDGGIGRKKEGIEEKEGRDGRRK